MLPGVDVGFAQVQDELDGRCAWVDVRAAHAVGQLTAWESGEWEFKAQGADGQLIARERRTLAQPTAVSAAADDGLRRVAEYVADPVLIEALARARDLEASNMPRDQAVILDLRPGSGFDLPAAEERLYAVAERLDAEFDGNEIAVDGSEVRFFLYGPDADTLYEAVSPVVRELRLAPGSFAIKRYGAADEPDAPVERIALS
jgi:hypothetical protein